MNDFQMPNAQGETFGFPQQESQEGLVDHNVDTQQIMSERNWRLDGNRILYGLEMNLRGKLLNPETGDYEQRADPYLNQDGINRIITTLNFHIGNIDARLTNLSIEQVNAITHHIRKTIRRILILNMEEYEIKSIDNLMNVVVNSSFAVFYTLRRSFDDGERKHLDTTEKLIRTEQFIQQPDKVQQKGGMFSKLV